MKKRKVPLIEWLIDENVNDITGIDLISVVEDPAIEVKGVAFGKDVPMDVEFATVESKQMIAGPVMIPNKQIYRAPRKDYPQGFYGSYTEDTVRKVAEKFFRMSNTKALNLEHTDKMIPGFIVESWIVEDVQHDKSKLYGFDLPVGTWFAIIKVDNKEYFQELVDSGKFSFSVEGLMYEQPINHKNENVDQWMKELDKDAINQAIDAMTLEDIIEAFKDYLD